MQNFKALAQSSPWSSAWPDLTHPVFSWRPQSLLTSNSNSETHPQRLLSYWLGKTHMTDSFQDMVDLWRLSQEFANCYLTCNKSTRKDPGLQAIANMYLRFCDILKLQIDNIYKHFLIGAHSRASIKVIRCRPVLMTQLNIQGWDCNIECCTDTALHWDSKVQPGPHVIEIGKDVSCGTRGRHVSWCLACKDCESAECLEHNPMRVFSKEAATQPIAFKVANASPCRPSILLSQPNCESRTQGNIAVIMLPYYHIYINNLNVPQEWIQKDSRFPRKVVLK